MQERADLEEALRGRGRAAWHGRGILRDGDGCLLLLQPSLPGEATSPHSARRARVALPRQSERAGDRPSPSHRWLRGEQWLQLVQQRGCWPCGGPLEGAVLSPGGCEVQLSCDDEGSGSHLHGSLEGLGYISSWGMKTELRDGRSRVLTPHLGPESSSTWTHPGPPVGWSLDHTHTPPPPPPPPPHLLLSLLELVVLPHCTPPVTEEDTVRPRGRTDPTGRTESGPVRDVQELGWR